MAKKLKISELGNPALRAKTVKVDDPKNVYIQNLIEDMILTMDEANGVGIAAPQVCEKYQIFIIHPKSNSRYPNAPDMEPKAIINPEIISLSEEIEIDWEGCLSIPGLRGLVPRNKSIKVKYTDINGDKIEETLEQFPARIFQHEYDHLQGILFLDRIESINDLFTENEYNKLIEHIEADGEDF